MNKRNIQVSVDEAIVSEAEAIFNSIGLDVEMALAMFLRRTVVEGCLPFSMIPEKRRRKAASALPDQGRMMDSLAGGEVDLEELTPRRGRARSIDPFMLEAVWEEFRGMIKGEVDLATASMNVSRRSQMNPSTALMWLSFLMRLAEGERNTSTLSVKYLRYFVPRMKSCFDSSCPFYENAIKSLELSLKGERGWLSTHRRLGNYGRSVLEYLEELKAEDLPRSGEERLDSEGLFAR